MDTPLLLAAKLAAATSIGLLIGLEREWAHKEAGVRSFAIAALLGTISWLVSPILAYAEVGVVLVILILVNAYAAWKVQNLEITTSLALATTNVLGILVGTGSFFLAFACALVVTALLSWKTELITFTSKLTVSEIRGTLLLGFITAIVYPLLPDIYIDPWRVLDPRSVWLTVVIVSGLSFVNYVLLRQFGMRGIRYSSLLGGLVNSAATSLLLAQEVKRDPASAETAPSNILLADMAMILRDGTLVFIFAWPRGLLLGLAVLIVLGSMFLVAAVVALIAVLRSRKPGTAGPQKPPLKSPLELRSVLVFGLLFLSLTVVSGLANRFFGAIGFLVVVVVGALASAASSAVLVGKQLEMGMIGAAPAAAAMFFATLVGLMENVTIFWGVTGKPGGGIRLLLFTLPIVLVGGLAVALVLFFRL